MSATFRGDFVQKLDGKGRVSIPVTFRRVLEENDPNASATTPAEFVIVYGDTKKPYLECYTIRAIEEVDAKIRAMKRGSRPRRILERMFNGFSHQVSVDDTGRIVLPAKLRTRLKLDETDKEIVFFASGDTFQIWNPVDFETEAVSEIDAFLDDLDEDQDVLEFLDDPTLRAASAPVAEG